MKAQSKSQSTLSSVDRALKVLNAFSIEQPELGITELAYKLNISTSSAHRLVATLEKNNFLVQNKTSRKYQLSSHLLQFSGIIYSQMEVYEPSQPILRELVNRIGETAHISVMDNTKVLYVMKENCQYPIKLPTYVGGRLPSYITASGTAMLAFQSESMIEKVLMQEGNEPNPLINKINSIRKRGFALSKGKLVKDVFSFGFPIRDYRGKVVAGLNVSGPLARFDRKQKEIIKYAGIASEKISKQLGY